MAQTSVRKERDTVQEVASCLACKESEDERTCKKHRSDKQDSICRESFARCREVEGSGIQPQMHPQAWVAAAGNMPWSHQEEREVAWAYQDSSTRQEEGSTPSKGPC